MTGRQAGRKAAEPALERVAPGGIEQGDLDAGAAAVDVAQHRLEAEPVAADVRLGPDLRVDRNHVALAIRLDAEAGEEDQGDRARLDLAVQPLEGAAHAVAGQVFADIDTEAVALELVGDVAGVVDRLFQRRLGVRIFRVADDQRKTFAGSEARGRSDDAEKSNVRSNARRIFIITAVQPKKRRSQLAPRRPYSTQTALSNDPREPSTACEVVINCDNSPRRGGAKAGMDRAGRHPRRAVCRFRPWRLQSDAM